MSAKVDQFCDNLRDRLNAMEGRLVAVKANVQALPKQAEKALREKLDESQTKLHAHKQRLDQAWSDLKTRSEQKMAQTKETINQWKAKQETRKLTARAEGAEAYAAAALTLAALMIDEAEEAIVDAVAARKEADGPQ